MGFQQPSARNERLAKALMDVRSQNAILAIRLFSFLWQVAALLAVRSGHHKLLWTCVCSYILMLPFAARWVIITKQRLRALGTGLYLLLHLPLLTYDARTSFELTAFLQMSGARVVAKLCISLLILESRLSACLNLLGLCAFTWKCQTSLLMCPGMTQEVLQKVIFAEAGSTIGVVCFAVLVELLFISRVQTLYDLEGSCKSTQHLLSHLCDADVQLDEGLRICGSCTKLQSLLMAGSAATVIGKAFTEFLTEEDRSKFHNLLLSNTLQLQDKDGGAGTEQHLHPTGSVRVNMCGSANLTFAAEIFHVPMLLGGNRTCHLLGVKECDSGDHFSIEREHVAPLSESNFTSISRRSKRSTTDRRPKRPADEHLQFAGLSKVSVVVDAAGTTFPIRKVELSFADDAPLADLSSCLRCASWPDFSAFLMLNTLKACNGQELDARSLGDYFLKLVYGKEIKAGSVVFSKVPGEGLLACLEFSEMSTSRT
eukprot:TRINITY_DN12363_c0_g3_i2.p1 TRINITY_DN12363_c0_g3~~TRINITY_DN12363_c0_g3_i2.p1  ORF type:complete len:552 (-),score=86.23 TRINITY_DN12363_c0_g3_i2:51-1502(-)